MGGAPIFLGEEAVFRSGDATYEMVLARVAARWGPLGTALATNQRRRVDQTTMLTTDHDTFLRAIGQVMGRLNWLADLSGIHPELQYLVRSAAELLARGVEDLLAYPEPRDAAEARLLMEIEVLMRLFARHPDELNNWVDIEHYRRNQKYGFGKLLEREGMEREIPSDHVLKERDEYRTHSSSLHPIPSDEQLAPIGDELTDMFSSLGDLLQHGVRTFDACSLAVAECSPTATLRRPMPTAPDLDRSLGLIKRFHRLVGVPEEDERVVMVARKAVRERGGTVGWQRDRRTATDSPSG
jgi:hypothetical protein